MTVTDVVDGDGHSERSYIYSERAGKRGERGRVVTLLELWKDVGLSVKL